MWNFWVEKYSETSGIIKKKEGKDPSVVWSHHYSMHFQRLEDVQNQFMITCTYKMGYPQGTYDHETILGLLNLEFLYDNGLLFLHKMLSVKIICNDLLSFCLSFHNIGQAMDILINYLELCAFIIIKVISMIMEIS